MGLPRLPPSATAAWAEGSHHGSCNSHWFLFGSAAEQVKKKKNLSTFRNAILKKLISYQQTPQFDVHGIKAEDKKPGITKHNRQIWQLSFPDLVLKGKSVHWGQNHTLLHTRIWAKALLLLVLFPSSSQRSHEIRFSPSVLFYFSLQLYKCSAAERRWPYVCVTLQPGTSFSWHTASLVFSLVAIAIEAIYTELNHIKRLQTPSLKISGSVMDEQWLPWRRAAVASLSQGMEV